ncbi:CBS domain-containing protein [Candidatus Woesearchaeota archaeon]|nr:CBS domain-containing protein [Candidatus Woesearchaeota archaeon]
MRVKEIMKKAVTISSDSSLQDAARIMAKEHIGSIIIVSGDEIKGIITERDILKSVSEDSKSLERPLSEFMSRDIVMIGSKRLIDDAASLMSQNKIKKLPVVDDGRLVGIITSTDIIAHSKDLGEFSLF